MRFRVAIFDCDGVLFNSEQANKAYYNKILEIMGRKPMSEQEFEYVHMHTAKQSLSYLFPDIEQYYKAIEVASKINYEEFIPLMKMEPGVIETLEEIRPHLKTAISTNRSTTMPKLIEEFGLDQWFDTIVCALDVENPKPDPEGVFKILEQLELQLDQAIYIGDSEVDQEVAEKAGIPLIAYKNPALRANFHVKHFFEIRYILIKSNT